MKILQEFKEFAVRGSVIDLAVGVIIGGAFQKIISSLVSDVLTPPISFLTGGVNFAERRLILQAAAAGGEPITLNYGVFIQNIVDFIIIAFVIFLMVKGINSLRRKPAEPEPQAPGPEEKLLIEIRDLLQARSGDRVQQP